MKNRAGLPRFIFIAILNLRNYMIDSGKLDNALIYLAGGMENVNDGGVAYRQIFKDKCKNAGLKIKFLDPTKKITGLTPDVNIEKARIDEYKKNKDWENLRQLMKKIVKQDLRQVDLSDMLVVFIDKNVPTFGTVQELVVAEGERKLVLIVPKQGKQSCPAWLFGIIHYDFIFDSDDEAVEYLVKLNNGSIPMNEKLILFRKELDEYVP